MSEVKIIKPTFKMFGDHTDPIIKVGEMARICYRSENNASPEADARLIKNCIGSGHTSVIEHGYIAIHFSNDMIDPKVFNVPELTEGFSTAQLWQQYNSAEIAKYTEVTSDPTIYKIIDGINAPVKVYPVVVGNFRAWLNILDSCMQASIAQGLPLGVAFICGIVAKGNEKFPQIFGSLYSKIDTAFAMCVKEHYLRKVFMPADASESEPLTIKHLAKFYDHFGIYLNAASSRSHLSVIVRTDRATTHQIVRHRRDCSYSQESQRYCNYEKKGYEVIWPSIDADKYGACTFDQTVVDGNNVTINQLPLGDSGFIPMESDSMKIFKESMQQAVDSYEKLLSVKMKNPNKKPEDPDPTLLPETARAVLPNAMATTIGITWTPATFTNVMFWRLEKHAQWPFRCLMGNILIEGLRTGHEFFENFLPGKILGWLSDVHKMKICTNEELIKSLIEQQKKRQRNIEEAAKRYNEEMEKRQAELRKQEEEKKEETPAESEPTPKETPAESAPTQSAEAESAPTPEPSQAQ